MKYAEAFEGMNIMLCEYRSERLWVSVWARIEEGKLTVEGQDLGPVPEEWFGSDEYEYFCFFDEAGTEKLLRALAEDSGDPVEEMKSRFSGTSGFQKLTDYCQENGIPYRRGSWHSG